MNSTQMTNMNVASDQSVIASYRNHSDAEAAVRKLAAGGIPMSIISIIGRNFETHEEIQGFYQPADEAVAGAGTGAWFGGIFGLMWGAMGWYMIPVVGSMFVLGPLAGLIAGAIGGAGIGALISGLMASGVPRDQAIKYQERLQAGEFLVVVHGSTSDTRGAHEILDGTTRTHLQTHDSADDAMAGMRM